MSLIIIIITLGIFTTWGKKIIIIITAFDTGVSGTTIMPAITL